MELLLAPASSPSVVPNAIPSAGSPNLILYPNPYVLPSISRPGPYLLFYFISETFLSTSNFSSM